LDLFENVEKMDLNRDVLLRILGWVDLSANFHTATGQPNTRAYFTTKLFQDH
jgi:hypothetical protein